MPVQRLVGSLRIMSHPIAPSTQREPARAPVGVRRGNRNVPRRAGDERRRNLRPDPLLAGVLVVGGMALLAAIVGVLEGGLSEALAYPRAREEDTETYGRGLYAADSVFTGAGFRGTDAVTLLVALPLLVIAALRRRSDPLGGGLVLAGMLAYFVYVYASLALAAAYNGLLLLHVAVLGAAVLSMGGVLARVDRERLASARGRLPRRRLGAFMIFSGVATAGIWLPDVVGALADDRLPDLDGYTTLVTVVLDVGIIVPLTLAAGVMLLRGNVAGYVVAVPLLVLEALLLPLILGQTILQLEAGVSFAAAELAGPLAGFLLLAVLAALLLRSVLAGLSEPAQRGWPARAVRPAQRPADAP